MGSRKRGSRRRKSRKPAPGPPALRDVEVLEDRTDQLSPREGFLRLSRLVLTNRYGDSTRSKPYHCDIVSRPCVDAVTVVLYQRDGDRVLVGLREGLRPPVYLRRRKPDLLFPDDPPYGLIHETVAGILEPADAEHDLETALARRAAAECLEEAGLAVSPADIQDLGGAAFPSPGVADEKVYFKAAEVDFSKAGRPAGDGSTMEESGRLVVLPLDEALARCRRGEIPDMKTEIGLARLGEKLGAKGWRQGTHLSCSDGERREKKTPRTKKERRGERERKTKRKR
ncbi:MAG: NUDIX hydrolase [Planctomycetota bacterium]